MSNCNASESLFHIVCHDSLLGCDDLSIRTFGIVHLIIVFFIMLELGVLDEFLLSSCHKGMIMNG